MVIGSSSARSTQPYQTELRGPRRTRPATTAVDATNASSATSGVWSFTVRTVAEELGMGPTSHTGCTSKWAPSQARRPLRMAAAKSGQAAGPARQQPADGERESDHAERDPEGPLRREQLPSSRRTTRAGEGAEEQRGQHRDADAGAELLQRLQQAGGGPDLGVLDLPHDDAEQRPEEHPNPEPEQQEPRHQLSPPHVRPPRGVQ